MLQISLTKILVYFPLIALLFFVFAFSYRSDQSFDQDLGRHLKLGEIISQTHNVPKTNLFSYTAPNFKFVNSHYLFEVLIFQIQRLIGLNSLLIIKILVICTTTLISVLVVPNWKRSLLLPVGFIFFHLLRYRLELRPEILSFLFTSGTLFVLNRFKEKDTRLIFILPVLQIIWINTHIYFVVGLSLQMIFWFIFLLGGQSQKVKSLTSIIIYSTILSLANPNFLEGLVYPLKWSTNYGYSIVENQSIFTLERLGFYDPNFLFYKLSVLIIIAGVVVALFKKSLKLENLILSCLGLALATLNVRGLPYLALISLPSTVANFGAVKNNLGFKVVNLITLTVLIYESLFYLSGSYYKLTDSDISPNLEFIQHSEPALNYVLDHKLPQPIYNNFDIGSYIIYRGYPNYKVFVDGRPEAYPSQFFQDVYIPSQMDESIFKQLNNQYNFQTIIFSISDQTQWGKNFLKQIVQNKDWQCVYLDDFMIVLVKTDSLQKLNIKPVDLGNINYKDYNFSTHLPYLRMSLFMLDIGQASTSAQFTQKALQIFPQSPIANSLMYYFVGQNPSYQNQFLSGEYFQRSTKSVWW